MEGFSLSNNTDKNKVFLVNFSDLKERYDPYFFKGEFHSLRKSLIKKGFINIGQILKSWNRGDGPRDGYYTDDSINGVNFLRVNNLKNNSIDISDVKYIERKIHNTKLKRTQVSAGDLIFAISGTKDNLGTVSIIPKEIKEANLNSALVRLDIDKTKISNEFFCLLFELPFIRTQIEFTGKGAAQNNLNNNEIKSILIPNISLTEQIKLVYLYQTAYTQKQQKEAQAAALLESIDSYLLNELGITLPEKDTSLQSRIFTTRFSEVSGGRFDAVSNKSKELEDALLNGKYSTIKLSKLIKGIKTGTTPHNSLNPYVDYGIPFLRNSNLQKGELDLSDIKFIKEDLANQLTYSSKGDIIVCIAGTVGESVVNTSDELLAINQNITALELDDNTVNINYLNYFLNTGLSIELTKRLCSIATILYLNNTNLLSLNIPLPPKEKQDEIANHIQSIRAQAKQLQEEAKMVLEEAKREVEKMIIG
ncbi:restriction endonuclease subunit S [Flavobacterium mekongense]|uniref:restriction endonuclease subunit S n=1 Tax=Flavobacterium mekongense TaxID=3379707 RepID=UPI003999818B